MWYCSKNRSAKNTTCIFYDRFNAPNTCKLTFILACKFFVIIIFTHYLTRQTISRDVLCEDLAGIYILVLNDTLFSIRFIFSKGDNLGRSFVTKLINECKQKNIEQDYLISFFQVLFIKNHQCEQEIGNRAL